MRFRVVVLGAGFGGLELATMLSHKLGDSLDLTLIDRSDSFVFGFSKLDVMFGRKMPDAVRLPYGSILKPGVTFRRETVTQIDPERRRVTTSESTYEADALVIALGAEYDFDATPGMFEGVNEFYTLGGACRMREELMKFSGGHVLIGVSGTPFKCPPAPSETALLLHDFLLGRGLRDACEISLVLPLPVPIPPSPASSQALMAAFVERGINFIPNRCIRRLDLDRGVAILDDGSEMSHDLFLGVPKHCVPDVVAESGMIEDGWIPVKPATLETRFAGVYAIGDVTSCGTPKAGVFSEAAAKVLADVLVAKIARGDQPAPFTGSASCYIEWGGNHVGRVDVDFLSGPSPTGAFIEPSTSIADEKLQFGAIRRARWFGLD